jgi:eukaryotic-like serine/threonine-protein kinase
MATCPTCRTAYPDDILACPADGDKLLPDEAFASADLDVQVGQIIGEYRVEGKLGEGGFGVVYRAVHPLIGKAAAIKVLNRQYSSNPQMVSRFISEARAVNQIRHRNIIDIFAFGSLPDGRQYFVMELLEGMPFDQYLDEQTRLSPEEAVPILRQIARALDAAHAAGIAHRDLKPENVFLVFDEDNGVFPKLLDFGIAKLLTESQGGSHKTRTGTPMGTPYFMSPEQCRGKSVDHRTDIYSFGVMTHKVLTGILPFDAEDVIDLLIKHTTVQPPTMSSVVPELPAALDAPVLHMMAKDPADRPVSLAAAVEELAAAAQAAGLAVELAGPKRLLRGPAGGPRVNSPDASTLTPSGGSGGGAKAGTPVEGAFAATALGAASPAATFLAAESDVPRSAKRRPVALWGVGAAVLLALAITGGMALRQSPEAASSSLSQGQPEGSVSPAMSGGSAGASAVAASAPSVAQSAAAPSASVAVTLVAPSTDVELTVKGAPAGAEVLLDGESLGKVPGPFKVKRAEGVQKVTVRAPGYQQRVVDFTPTASDTIKIKLFRVSGKVNSELESPF